MSTDVTPQVAAALDAAAIPQFKVGPRRHARLTDSERGLYFWILRQFAETGGPSGAEIREAAERFGLDAESALAILAREDLVYTDGDGEIAVAYPFSGRTTDHVVRFEGGHEVHAMCAIDALGIAPMFDVSIEIGSRDPLTRAVSRSFSRRTALPAGGPTRRSSCAVRAGTASPAAAAARC